jgi:hypothetical protein
MGHWVDTLVILGVTVINALIGHIQESNAEKSLQGIRNMLSSDARVQRNGKHETIPTRDLVPGDIVILRAGDRVPADMRLIEAIICGWKRRFSPASRRWWIKPPTRWKANCRWATVPIWSSPAPPSAPAAASAW